MIVSRHEHSTRIDVATTIVARELARRLRHARTEYERRAVAMMLVLVSLAGATILTAAYLASRDNSAVIGANITASAEARWGAQSGLETGIAVLETSADWRTSHVNGRIMSAFPVGNTTVNVDLVDLVTGGPPTASTTNVGILSIASVDGMSQIASATATVPLAGGQGVNVGLTEFATMVTDSISLMDRATITRWTSSPLAGLGGRVAVGTRATGAASITLTGDAAAIDTTVYTPPGASGALISHGSTGPPLGEITLLDPIPVPAPPAPPVIAPNPMAPAPDAALAGLVDLVTDTRAGGFVIQSGADVTATGTIDLVAETDLTIQSGSSLYIDGDVTLVVFGDVVIDAGSEIELEAGATLQMYVEGQLRLTDAYIGPRRVDDSVRDASGNLPWDDPARTRIYGSGGLLAWTLQNNSVIVGTVYVPQVEMRIYGARALYGSLVSDRLTMTADTGLFYDHGLETYGGYTNSTSSIYDGGGRILADILALGSLDTPALQALADAIGLTVCGGGADIPPSVAPPVPVIDPLDPTPRTVAITFDVKTTGSDVDDWSRTNGDDADLFGTKSVVVDTRTGTIKFVSK